MAYPNNSTNVRLCHFQVKDKTMDINRCERKNLHPLFSTSHKNVAVAEVDVVSLGKLSCRCSAQRVGQLLVAAMLAGGLHFLAQWSGDVVQALAAFAAISAFGNIGLAMESKRAAQALLNVIAVPIVFAAAYAGFNGAPEWLTISFVLHGSITALQIESVDKELRGGLFLWSVFNSTMSILLLLGKFWG
jgi:hypothetical protein